MAINEVEILEQLNFGIKKDPVTDAVLVAIESVNDEAIELARKLIMDQSKSKSGTSAQSIIALPIVQNGSSYSFSIEGDFILEFIDKGVNGMEGSFSSPYSFKNPNPSRSMMEAIKGWIPNTGFSLPPQFESYDDFSWAISAGIKKRGLKPKPFIEESFGEAFSTKLSEALTVALGYSINLKFDQIADRANSKR